MAERGFGRRVTVVNDAVGALWAGSPSGVGVVVNRGTGVAVAARAPDGKVWHAGFWLEGMSSDALENQALRAVYRAELGIESPTALTARLTAFYGQPTVEDLLHLFTARLGEHPRNVDQLARVVLDTASEGDDMARRLVAAQAAMLGDYALAAARQVGIAGTSFPLVLAGGLFRHRSRLLPEAIAERVRAAEPGAREIISPLEPVAGALLMAMAEAGAPVGESVLARISGGVPEAAFFAT
jgi:N-acetylglucosamine kinase-like BadF-type ATPase